MRLEDSPHGEIAPDVVEIAKHDEGLTTDIVGFFDERFAKPDPGATLIRPSRPFGPAHDACAPTEIED